MSGKKQEQIGLTEHVTIIGKNNKKKKIIARIDTGAVMSSIDIKLAAELELGPIKRTKIVKSANGKSRRPVVECVIRLRKKEFKIDTSIANRSHLKYRALIGQNLLKKTSFLINPRKSAKSS